MRAILIGNVNNKKVFMKLFKLQLLTKKKIHAGLHEVGAETVRRAKELMEEKKTGRIYTIRGVEYQASAPGEAPAIRSGRLYNSLTYSVRGSTEISFNSDLPDKYPIYLETGTKKMSPRPYFSAAAEEMRGENINTIISYCIQ